MWDCHLGDCLGGGHGVAIWGAPEEGRGAAIWGPPGGEDVGHHLAVGCWPAVGLSF